MSLSVTRVCWVGQGEVYSSHLGSSTINSINYILLNLSTNTLDIFRISLFQCISVADVCMLCLSYPVLGHDIALSNALRCIISVS